MAVNVMKGVVLVTGANGYIAGHVIDALLRAGYSVRGTVRTRKSAKPLCAALGEMASNLHIVEMPDIAVPGAFDDAAKGVNAFIHIASPVNVFLADPDVFMNASVQGLARALEAAEKEQTTVKSFVFMSSVASIFSEKEEDYTFTEADWNTYSEPIVAQKGKNAPGHIIYEASKVAAERTLWKFRDECKPSFAVTTVNPILCAGPSVVVPTSSDQVHISTKMIWNVFIGEELEKAAIPGVYQGYVDVRDVARAVVFAVDHPEKADGERFILARYYSPPQAIADLLRDRYPDRVSIIQKGMPGQGYLKGHDFPSSLAYDGSKVARVTGRDYTPWEETVIDTIESLKKLL